jgi:hypothetical protein
MSLQIASPKRFAKTCNKEKEEILNGAGPVIKKTVRQDNKNLWWEEMCFQPTTESRNSRT